MKTETFYTGGGIWISQYDAGGGFFAVVSNDCPDCLSVYRKTGDEDEDAMYLPENMVSSKNLDELNDEQRAVHAILKAELVKKGAL